MSPKADSVARRFTLVGPGRAGQSIQRALTAKGWSCEQSLGRDDDFASAARGVDVCIIAVPDAAIARVAAQIEPGEAVLVHLSGATPIDVLGDHHRRAALHPLLSLAEPESGAAALATTFFAVGGDPIAQEMAELLSGKWFPIADADRALYHGAAAVASNHLVALLGQVERIAKEIDVPFEAFVPLVQSSIDNVVSLGPRAALTGPAARGDDATIDAHIDALRERLPLEVAAYESLVAEARRLAQDEPSNVE